MILTTAELIAQLQTADPSGTAPVWVAGPNWSRPLDASPIVGTITARQCGWRGATRPVDPDDPLFDCGADAENAGFDWDGGDRMVVLVVQLVKQLT